MTLPCTHIHLSWADAGYPGKLATWAAAALKITVEIGRKRDATPSRSCPAAGSWKELCAWISTHHRCVRDYERLPASHEAMVPRAMIALMAQRFAQTRRPE